MNKDIQRLTKESDKLTKGFIREIYKDRHILLIGGAGYIGSVLTKKMLSKGYKVRVLDKLLYKNGSSISDLMEDKHFSFILGDFGNSDILDIALSEITDVVLLAALVGDPICKKYPELAKKTNIDYSKNLFQKLINRNINKFIFASTCSNYGLRSDDSLANEDSELNPQSLYAETKVEFEKYILENIPNIDFSPTILRLSTAFGISRRMRFDLTISEFTKDLALGRELMVFDENSWRPYCNVLDISDFIIKIIEIPKEKVSGQIFNIGSDQNNYTKKMIVDLIQKQIKNSKIEFKKGCLDPRNYRVSFKKAKQVLGLDAKHSVEESIKQLINSIRNNLYTDIEIRKNFYGNYEIHE